jgi:hypothetical protein
MGFDLARQEQEFVQVKEEFARLNSQFNAVLKAQGVTVEDLRAEKFDVVGQELQELLDTARARAKRAGEERIGHFQTASGVRPASHIGHRAGAVRL